MNWTFHPDPNASKPTPAVPPTAEPKRTYKLVLWMFDEEYKVKEFDSLEDAVTASDKWAEAARLIHNSERWDIQLELAKGEEE